MYREIAPPAKLVVTECYDEPSVGCPEWQSTLTLEDLGGKTKLTSRVLHASKANRDGQLSSGMEHGAAETFDRLEELLAASPMEREIEIERVFDAPRELVFDAWTNPEHMTRWWGPKIFTNHSCELDVQPGGAWQITMRSPDGVDHRCHGIFTEVVKPERLVFTNDAVDHKRQTTAKRIHDSDPVRSKPQNKTNPALSRRRPGGLRAANAARHGTGLEPKLR